MHSLAAYTLLASASLAVAIDPRFEFPDTVPLVKRQQPGTPQYACHEDCGLLITLARDDEDFCDSDEWNERYGRCMSCANTYDIWKYYGSGVGRVAQQCGLTPKPSPSGSSGAASTTAEEKPSSTAAEAKPSTTAVEKPATTEVEEAETTKAEEQATATEEAEEEETTSEHEHEGTEHAHTSTEAEHSEAHEHTTLATHAAETTHAANPTKTHEAGHTSADEIGTIGVTATSTPLPSSVIVNGAAKQVGFSTAMVVVALAMCGLY
ncbi:hypothetical protein IWW34DRAFT_716396 [Fusarium oxysporum f. sp. albedinis]|nr:hypothetical protein FOMA001_g113 [Fusarium oxysporum f. sp. matthiolae]KAI3585731.1 hypothetical protein IWW34DRAFT_716396 [Fusarium oxysporum f. sp. albedinis]KAJ0141666.1 hypothetical protein HZ326_15477 [Fusarium oxysporum f. sp. albedinis]KAK2486176.1 hypothetical protein H9L39_00103 [Fusarium oxysporum f. sp. albedinis]